MPVYSQVSGSDSTQTNRASSTTGRLGKVWGTKPLEGKKSRKLLERNLTNWPGSSDPAWPFRVVCRVLTLRLSSRFVATHTHPAGLGGVLTDGHPVEVGARSPDRDRQDSDDQEPDTAGD